MKYGPVISGHPIKLKVLYCMELLTNSLLSCMKNCFLLKDIFMILDQENTFILILFWNTTSPICVTPNCNSLFALSFALCSSTPYISIFLAWSRKLNSASAGNCPLGKINSYCILIFATIVFFYLCSL